MMFKEVVLPAPFGPMIDVISFLLTSKDADFKATRPPNVLLSLSTRNIVLSLSSKPKYGWGVFLPPLSLMSSFIKFPTSQK